MWSLRTDGRLLQDLPAFILHFARRFLTGAYETPSSTLDAGALERDAFGFRKLVVVASDYGKVQCAFSAYI